MCPSKPAAPTSPWAWTSARTEPRTGTSRRRAGWRSPPPNLPVLHADLLAKDVVTYLTRMAKTPSDRILYRHYLNDPWFEQYPWYDIYNREPLEAYTALSCSRLNADGYVIRTRRGRICSGSFSRKADAKGLMVKPENTVSITGKNSSLFTGPATASTRLLGI